LGKSTALLFNEYKLYKLYKLYITAGAVRRTIFSIAIYIEGHYEM
jgi:hypothetical protein